MVAEQWARSFSTPSYTRHPLRRFYRAADTYFNRSAISQIGKKASNYLRFSSNSRFLELGIRRGLSSILLEGPALKLFLVFSGFGLFFLAINSYQTTNPVWYYGNDVFDSSMHTFSYIAMRIVLGLSWVVLYPYSIVVLIAVAGNIYRLTAILKERKRLAYKRFHPDGCVGYAFVGTINFLVILGIAVLYLALGAVVVVHHKLNVLQISGVILLSALLLLSTFWISWPVTSFLSRAQKIEKIRNYRYSISSDSEFAVTKILWILIEKPFSPYSAHQKMVINAVRLLPAAVAGLRLWISLR